jgi:hypothetical protein
MVASAIWSSICPTASMAEWYPGCCGRFTLHLPVLTVGGGEVGLELCPSFFSKGYFVPPATGAHEVPSCKYF